MEIGIQVTFTINGETLIGKIAWMIGTNVTVKTESGETYKLQLSELTPTGE